MKMTQPGEIGHSPKGTLTLSADLLPAIKDWEVGKTYHVTLKVKQTGLSQYSEKEPLRANFEVIKAETEADQKKAELTARVNDYHRK